MYNWEREVDEPQEPHVLLSTTQRVYFRPRKLGSGVLEPTDRLRNLHEVLEHLDVLECRNVGGNSIRWPLLVWLLIAAFYNSEFLVDDRVENLVCETTALHKCLS